MVDRKTSGSLRSEIDTIPAGNTTQVGSGAPADSMNRAGYMVPDGIHQDACRCRIPVTGGRCRCSRPAAYRSRRDERTDNRRDGCYVDGTET